MHDRADTHYRDSERHQGVKLHNQHCNKSTQWVRGHPDSPGVREHTCHDSTQLSEYNYGSTHSSPGFDPVEPPSDSTDEDGYSSYCSRALLQPDLCRQDQSISIELESPDQRQLGPRNSDRGVSHSAPIPAYPANNPPQPPLTSRGSVGLGGRGQVTLAETGDSTSPHPSSGILFQHVHGAQERRRSETCHQPQTLEQFCEIRAFQDGRPTHSQSPPLEEQLDGPDRPQRCLFHGTNSPPISQSPFQSGVRNIPIQVPPFRAVHCPQSVYQNPQTSGGNAEVNRHTSSDIHRRHASNGILQQTAHRAGLRYPIPPREYRVHNQQQKVPPRPNLRNRISGNVNQLSEVGYQPSRWKDQEYQTGGTEIIQSSQTLSSPPLSINWQAQCYHPSTPDGSSLLSLPPEVSKTSSGIQFPELSIPCSVISPGCRRSSVVDTSSFHVEWEEPDHSASLTNNNFGCFSSRVGSHLQWNPHQRSMVSSGANPSHQLFGAPGSHISSTIICQGEVRHHNPSQDRQHHCGCLHQQNGGDCITYTFATNQGAMVMVHGKEYPVTGSALTRSIEFHC